MGGVASIAQVWCGPHLSARLVMVDNKTKQAADRRRIDVDEPYELGYWSRKFGVSVQRLSETIQMVGPMVDDVERELVKSKIRRSSKSTL